MNVSCWVEDGWLFIDLLAFFHNFRHSITRRNGDEMDVEMPTQLVEASYHDSFDYAKSSRLWTWSLYFLA